MFLNRTNKEIYQSVLQSLHSRKRGHTIERFRKFPEFTLHHCNALIISRVTTIFLTALVVVQTLNTQQTSLFQKKKSCFQKFGVDMIQETKTIHSH